MSDEYGSTTGQDTPGPSSSDAPNENDAMAHVDISTEEVADKERQEAKRADVDNATQRDRVEEGRIHSRAERDRGETGGV